MSTNSLNKIELHFELMHISNRNVKDVVRDWQQIHDNVPYEALWSIIQLFVDSTGYLNIKIDQSSTNFKVNNFARKFMTILKGLPKNHFSTEKFILNSSKLNENISTFLREIITANCDTESFFEHIIKPAIESLLQFNKKSGEIFYTTGSVILMNMIWILLDIGQNCPENCVNVVAYEYAPTIFTRVVDSFQFHDCAYIMCPTFLSTFEILQYDNFESTILKNIFMVMLKMADSTVTLKVMLVIKNVFETRQSVADKLYLIDLFGTKEIMVVLLADAINKNKRIAVEAHQIVNTILNNSKTRRIKQHNYQSLLLRMYDTNSAIRKLAGTTFHILHPNEINIEKMITFYLQYYQYDRNISRLVDACCMVSQIDIHVNEIIAIIQKDEISDTHKIIGGKILLELYKSMLRDTIDSASALLRRIPELLEATSHIPHLTLNLLEIISDTTNADASIISPIFEYLAKLVVTHSDYDILCAGNVVLDNLNNQLENLGVGQSSLAGTVQTIFNDYNLARIKFHEEPVIYKNCLIRFRAAAEFIKSIDDYLNETLQSILDSLFSDIKSNEFDDGFREHQIVLYTTLVNASFAKHACVELVQQTVPFLNHLITLLSESTMHCPSSLVKHAILPGICIFFIIASHPIDAIHNFNRIKDIPSYLYVHIGTAIFEVAATVYESQTNMRVTKILLEYWVNLHKVQKIPNRPKANKILVLYGNVKELSDLLENLMMGLYHFPADHSLLVASIGQSFINLRVFDKKMASNYTKSLYKYFNQRKTNIEEDIVHKLFNSILIFVLGGIEEQLKTVNLEKTNRLVMFSYLRDYIKCVNQHQDHRILQIINRFLAFETLSTDETTTLESIKTQLEH